jgi:lipoate-protein ligase A
MDAWRLLEITYDSLAEHEPLRRALIEVRNRRGEGAENTLLCFSVRRPCVQLGEFQDIDEELDLEECRRRAVDISRRVGGGGCIYYDDRTRFAVALCDRGTFPDLEEAAKAWQGEVVTGTLRSLGAKEAWYRHIGDVQIGQNKVSGLGTALIQNTLYLGSFMNIGTPRVDVAQKVLRIPPEKFADKAVSKLDEYVTSVEKVTGRLPSWEEFKEAVRQNLERVFRVKVRPGEIDPEEKVVLDELRPVYTSEEWIYKRSSNRRFGELPDGIRTGKNRRKARKLVIARVAVNAQNRIYRAMLAGDFFIQPAGALEEMEKSLHGAEALDEKGIQRILGDALARLKAQTPMLTAEDFALPVIQAAKEAMGKNGNL